MLAKEVIRLPNDKCRYCLFGDYCSRGDKCVHFAPVSLEDNTYEFQKEKLETFYDEWFEYISEYDS